MARPKKAAKPAKAKAAPAVPEPEVNPAADPEATAEERRDALVEQQEQMQEQPAP